MGDHPRNPAVRLLDGDFYADDPHPSFAWMRAHAPVYWDEGGGVWGIARHADVMRVSKDPATFCSGGGTRPDAPNPPSMINLDDPLHKRRRSLVNRGFTPRRVRDHARRIRGICVDLIEKARAKGEFDFVAEVAAPLPMAVIGDLLGVEPEDRDRLLRWSDDMLRATSATASAEDLEGAARAFADFSQYHHAVVQDRRSRPRGDDLMSILVHAEIDGERLADEELLQDSLLILVGGDETTRHVISGGAYQLLRRAELLEGLVARPEGVPRAVEEMLRWVSPIQNMSRTALRDVEVGGQRIRAGDKLLLLYPSANRDETIFAEPQRFDPARDPNPHVAFGGYGTHFCLGASLARLELHTLFEELVRRMPRLGLESEERPPMRSSNFITGIESLPVRVLD